jgi:hypothetical protein
MVIVEDFKDFDPAHPDALAALNLAPLPAIAGGQKVALSLVTIINFDVICTCANLR